MTYFRAGHAGPHLDRAGTYIATARYDMEASGGIEGGGVARP
ncbi:MAG: hypothetical protein ACLQB4_04795 [Beijerinckiaceae bacterium]